MESNTRLEAKGVSDEARVLQFLREVKEANPLSVNVEVHTPEWIRDYPDIEQLIAYASDQGLVDAIPNKTTGQDEEGRSYFWSLSLRPKLVKILKAEPRAVHRQVTVDEQKIDLRTMVGHVLATPNIQNLADACRIWLADLENEGKATARRKVRILLSRAIGIRGQELAEYAPHLKEQIMEALLCESGERGKWVTERESERGR
jgi:hypothetical protein